MNNQACGDHDAIVSESQRDKPACSDLTDIRPILDIALTTVVVSRGNSRTVGLQSHRVRVACGNLGDQIPAADIELS